MWSRSFQRGFRCMAIGSLVLAAGAVFYEQGNRYSRTRESAKLHGKIVEAQRLIADSIHFDARLLEKAAPSELPLNTNLPVGSAQVWLPELVRKHFKAAGHEVAIVRLNSLHEMPESREFQRGYWSVALPVDDTGDNVPGLLTAVAQFERQNSYVRVLDFTIGTDPENPGKRIAGMNLTTLVSK